MSNEPDRSQHAVVSKCTACRRSMDWPFFCDHCHSLYPADSLNYFEMLGLEPRYELDQATLRQRYLQASRGVHPDQHGDSGDALSMRLSAQLNEAHRVLRDPVLRAEYLLELLGGKSATEDKHVPPEVLSTTLMLREEIEEAREADDQAALQACAEQIREYYEQAAGRVAALAPQLPGDDALRNELRAALNAVKYYQKLRNEVQT